MGMSVAQLHEYRAFLAKLEKAIEAQEKIVLASQKNRISQMENWQQKHMQKPGIGQGRHPLRERGPESDGVAGTERDGRPQSARSGRQGLNFRLF